VKFKIGDKVRVREGSRYMGGKYANAEGKIHMVWKGNPHPYAVTFAKFYLLSNCDFHANELEAA